MTQEVAKNHQTWCRTRNQNCPNLFPKNSLFVECLSVEAALKQRKLFPQRNCPNRTPESLKVLHAQTMTEPREERQIQRELDSVKEGRKRERDRERDRLIDSEERQREKKKKQEEKEREIYIYIEREK